MDAATLIKEAQVYSKQQKDAHENVSGVRQVVVTKSKTDRKFFLFPEIKLTYFLANYILRLFAESEVARDKLNLIERMQDAKIDFRQLLKFKDTIYAGDLDVDKEITEQQFR